MAFNNQPDWKMKFKKEELVAGGEDDYEFFQYAVNKMYRITIQVAGGGMSNGNAYACIEAEWATEEDFNDGADGEIFYCEYGDKPIREYRGSQLKFNEEGTSFNIE